MLVQCTDRRNVPRQIVFGLHDGTMRAELLKTHLKSDGMPKNMQDVVAEAKALESAQKANKLIADATKGIEEQVNWISHKQMKLKREPGTCFWCGDRHGPHPRKTCPANGKTCTKCGINDHFSRVCLETGPPQQEPRRTTQWQAQGRGRGYRAPRGRSQPKPLVNKPYICCRRQMINTSWNTKLMTTKNSATPWKHGKYTASTKTTQRKNTLLHCLQHVCNREQIHPSGIPNRHRRHLQYLV